MIPDPKHHEQLTAANERVAQITAELRKAEGKRDELLRPQCDNEGCHDRRAAVR